MKNEHYEKAAAIVRGVEDKHHRATAECVFIMLFESEDPDFDRSRFEKACLGDTK